MLRKIFSYGTLAAAAALLQIILIIYAVTAGARIPAVGIFYCMLTIGSVIYILNSDMPDSYKLSWIIPMLCFPVYGGAGFILFNKKHSVNKLHRRMEPYLYAEMRKIKGIAPETHIQRYLSAHAGFPAVTSAEEYYFPLGEQLFEEMLNKIKSAEKYVFLEFFIIAEGKAWNELKTLLIKKAEEGVQVRIIIDGAGCLFTKPAEFRKSLKSAGIEVLEFNPVRLRISASVNYRNHRKLLICDGKYAFCCGINISDEYMNMKERFGKWKDTGVMVSGAAALSFTAMFNGMWNYLSGKDMEFTYNTNYEHYENPSAQPFSDTPLDNEAVGLRTYLALISSAKSSIYITTPYLICSEEMLNSLKFASRRGVSVYIITPGIPDKKYVYTLTRSYYKELIAAGVRIYEYSPGFIHSKTLVIDEKTAVVGTINFDYRSMYLLFECACIFYGGNIPKAVSDDFSETIKACNLIEYSDAVKTNTLVRIVRGLLKLFAPLM